MLLADFRLQIRGFKDGDDVDAHRDYSSIRKLTNRDDQIRLLVGCTWSRAIPTLRRLSETTSALTTVVELQLLLLMSQGGVDGAL